MGSIEVSPGDAHFTDTEFKYDRERQKRLRADGLAQFVDTTRSEKFQHFARDPWYSEERHTAVPHIVAGSHARILILGGGFGALTFAVRLIQAGVSVDDILLVEAAGGFGGTWYWNRYPGLMCDVESACYMPLLEETGYTPRHKYSYGGELREYANLVAQKWGLDRRALFRVSADKTEWNEEKCEWISQLTRTTDAGQEKLWVRSDFFCLNGGLLVHPKLPLIPGLETFTGQAFHTSRWDYGITGGSPQDPRLVHLRNKRVGIIGTGATSIQAVPELAKWAKDLYVFQRTPSAVSVRGQQPMTEDMFKAIRGGRGERDAQPGWQRARRENMAAFLSNPVVKPPVDLVDDGWTSFPSFSGLVGGPRIKAVAPSDTDSYVAYLHALDFARQEGVRARVSSLVNDPNVAESLKPWYPGWCKRPCFHDEYLQSFNKRNVHLVDTHGAGVDAVTASGLTVGDTHYEFDVLIFATGFEPWSAGSPAHRAGITVIGRDGLDMNDKWATGVGTLHGVFTRGFPNLILPGGAQTGLTVNIVHSLDIVASHFARVLMRAEELRAIAHGGEKLKVVLEPSKQGEEDWTQRVLGHAHALAGLAGCTPSYITAEGKLGQASSPEEHARTARGAPWTPGALDFVDVLDEWFGEGSLQGLELREKAVRP